VPHPHRAAHLVGNNASIMYHPRDVATDEARSSQQQASNKHAGAATRDHPPWSGGGKLPDYELFETTPTCVTAASSTADSIATSSAGFKRRASEVNTNNNNCCASAATKWWGPPSASCGATMSSSLCEQKEQQHQPHRHVGGVTNDALRHFTDAMALIEPKVKEGYGMALQKCPATVFQHECCPCYFVVACHSNPWDAAVRMCSYWTERIHLFEDRAFEPITLGSDVAEPSGLSRDDMKVLETGAVLLLPSDRDGRTVLLLDHSRLAPHMIEQYKSRLRVVWYMFQSGYRSGEAQAHKLATIVSMTKPPPSGQFGMGVWRYGAGAVRLATSMPIVVDAIHLLTLPVKFGTGRMMQIGLSVCATMLGSLFSTVTKVHHGQASGKVSVKSNAEGGFDEDVAAKPSLLQQLKPYGFTKRGIPDVAGGLFTYESFQFWLKRQRRIERKVIWTEDQRVKQKRDVNRLHSQQKRQRRRQELEELQEQVDQYTAANQQARHVQAQLEKLLDAAHESVRRATTASAAATSPAPTYDFGLPRTTAPAFPQQYSEAIWGHGDAPMAQVPAQGVDNRMCPSMHAALEPDPIAPACLPRKLSHRDSSGSTAFEALSTYQAFETWDAFHSPSEHSSMRKRSNNNDEDAILLSQLHAASAEPIRWVMPPVPKERFQFTLPSDGFGVLVPASSRPTKFTADGGGTCSTPSFHFDISDPASTSVDRIESAPGLVQQPVLMSRAMHYQRQYLPRSLEPAAGNGADLHLALLQPGSSSSSHDPIGPPHGTAGMAPKIFSSAFGGRGQESGLTHDLPDPTTLLEHFRYLMEPKAAAPSTTILNPNSHRNHPSSMDCSEVQRNPSGTPSFWPIDALTVKDLDHDYSMDPSPLVDDTVFYDLLC
jgi:hypothetical protein